LEHRIVLGAGYRANNVSVEDIMFCINKIEICTGAFMPFVRVYLLKDVKIIIFTFFGFINVIVFINSICLLLTDRDLS
jgi:hypothetical protein